MKIYKIDQYIDVGWGESIFLIGNGESVSYLDLTKLPQDKVMTMNRSWKLAPNAKYHSIIMHSGYVKDIATQEKQPEVLFIAGSPNEVETKYKKMLKNEVCFVSRRSPEWNYKVTPDDFLDLRKGWYPTHAGLFSIQVAHTLGYDNIFLIGFDGYGCHFERDEINPLNDHARHKRELEFMKEAVEKEEISSGISGINIYNLNTSNAYKVFERISLVDALDIASGDI